MVYTPPTLPTPSTGTARIYQPLFTTGPKLTIGSYRAWSSAVVDGVQCFADGRNQPWYWDGGSNFFDLGSNVPTDFTLALSSAGAPAAIPTGRIARYYVVRANSTLGKETAPQLAVAGDAFFPAGAYGVSISNASGSTRDVTVAWTPQTVTDLDVRRIYRALDGTDGYKFVKEVAEATGTYLDVDPDANLLTHAGYVFTYRTTKPPKLRVLFEHLNRLWGATGNDESLYYFQIARTDARFVADDLPPGNQLPLEPNDGHGRVRGGFSHNGFLYALKERASYQVDGFDASDFVVTQMYEGRGMVGPRCFISVNEIFIILDELGPYGWTPGGIPRVLGGGGTGTPISVLAPLWKRLNLGASNSFFVTDDPSKHLIFFHIAIDYSPVPNYVVVYDYRRDVFVTDPAVWRTAGGDLLDSSGIVHRCALDDMNNLWEEGVGDSDGVYAGTLAAVITGGSTTAWIATAASFDSSLANGCFGSLVERLDASGDLIEQNRVAAVTASTTLSVLYFYTGSTALAAGQGMAPGSIPALAQGGKQTLGSDAFKHVVWATLEHDVQAANNALVILSAPDNIALAAPPVLTSVDLSANRGRSMVAVSDRGVVWTWQIGRRYAGQSFAVRTLTMHYTAMGTPR